MHYPIPLSRSSALRIPLVASTVRAGFPSPADDYVQDNINLNTLLVDDPDCTFLMMASNDAIHGIFKGDYVLIDKARTPVHGNVVVAAHEDGFVLRRLHKQQGMLALLADAPGYPMIPAEGDYTLQIWGVVIAVVRRLV
ncbi:LexA family transcriptional regulator [Aquitalea sp. ASV15]|uniref:LexA family protein n=1 Tax=Aquitalea sp. ASV15 TaxID=2795104 RepID=UPI0018EBF5B2|nr:S24 family peptidase [Aquitalea sp. ASV15]